MKIKCRHCVCEQALKEKGGEERGGEEVSPQIRMLEVTSVVSGLTLSCGIK